MADLEGIAEPLDGRVARRQRNVDAVIDVVLELFAEESLFPTIEQAATRSGLSLRSLYRYFADPGELLEATIKRSREQGVEFSRLHAIGQGPLAQRIDEFAAMRLRMYDAIGAVYRATVANAARHPRISNELARNRNELRHQFEAQFVRELAERKPADRDVVLSAGDLLTQLDSIDYLRRHRQLSVAETQSVLVSTLRSLL
ncbi:MAG: TetR/AcrR family transcriptional regulator [Actinomycetia bacterium]|nr:TetR/AcrR family transcriptional regulator [Actinomycetes bacterium]MCP4963404.1 TetR/AcrR family transcriptional regulator [Actinomycetes bacterium]